GTILSWNRGAEALFGYLRDEAVGRNISFLAPPDHLDEVRPSLAKVQTGGTSRCETVRLAKDGRRIDVIGTGTPIRNSRGEIVGVAVIARDIGVRLRAEQSLRDSEERFRSAFENAPFGMCLSGMDGRFLRVNATMCRMLGYSEPELLAAGWPELTHPDDREASAQLAGQSGRAPGSRWCGMATAVRHILYPRWKISRTASGRRRRCAKAKSASGPWRT